MLKGNEIKGPTKIWRPGIDKLNKGEVLDYDRECYDLLSSFYMKWPCLSLTILQSEEYKTETKIPSDVYFATGTQADSFLKNRIYITRWNQNSHNLLENSTLSDSESEEHTRRHEKIQCCSIKHEGTINRIRACPQITRLLANWSDSSKVHIWDISDQLYTLESSPETTKSTLLKQFSSSPLFTYEGHKIEGYALDWNPHFPGNLISGDCKGGLSLWEPVEGGWSIISKNKKYKHNDSIEDIKWKLLGSGTGRIFATACVDGSIRIFDTRSPISIIQSFDKVHNTDINVLSWNPINENIFLSGDDVGYCKVWDIRFNSTEIANLHYHNLPITSLSWHPFDDSVFAASSYDDSITIWDLSVEGENEFNADAQDQAKTPDQLMFQHMGQKEISEIQFHPQYSGIIISTALCSFNIFKSFNID